MSTPILNKAASDLRLTSQQLKEAARHYREAWQAQRRATECYYTAFLALRVEYGHLQPPDVAAALESFNRAVEACELMAIEVGDDEAMRSMQEGTRALEAVGDAAQALADTLTRAGVLQ